jgi:hypothetical protein
MVVTYNRRLLSLLMSMGSDYVSEMRPPTGLYMNMDSHDNDRGIPKSSERNCHSATLSITNPIRTDTGGNPGFRGKRPATNCLSHGMA